MILKILIIAILLSIAFFLEQKGSVSKMYRMMNGSALEYLTMSEMPGILDAPDYLTYIRWILSKRHYGKMNKRKSRR